MERHNRRQFIQPNPHSNPGSRPFYFYFTDKEIEKPPQVTFPTSHRQATLAFEQKLYLDLCL